MGKCVSTECNVRKFIKTYTDSSNAQRTVYLGEIMVPSYNHPEWDANGECKEAYRGDSCGESQDHCEQTVSCHKVNPDCYSFCINEGDYAKKQCIMNYYCGCEPNKHYSSSNNNCVDDSVEHCGEENIACPVPSSDNHIESVKCENKKCKLTCVDGYKECNGACVQKGGFPPSPCTGITNPDMPACSFDVGGL